MQVTQKVQDYIASILIKLSLVSKYLNPKLTVYTTISLQPALFFVKLQPWEMILGREKGFMQKCVFSDPLGL